VEVKFKFDIPAWTAENLLIAWEKKYGELDQKFRTEFKSRTEIPKILEFHPEHIALALNREKRLSRILLECNSILAEIDATIEEPFGPPPFAGAHLYEEYEYGKDFI